MTKDEMRFLRRERINIILQTMNKEFTCSISWVMRCVRGGEMRLYGKHLKAYK